LPTGPNNPTTLDNSSII
nr:RecName: Full=Exochitosanase; AltName: Full=Exo-beta-D-glucosaminidase [Aspergillus flavus]